MHAQLTFKAQLEARLTLALPAYDVNWRRIYNIVRNGGWNDLLEQSQNVGETALALQNVKGDIPTSMPLSRALSDSDMDRFYLLLEDGRVEWSKDCALEINAFVSNDLVEVIPIMYKILSVSMTADALALRLQYISNQACINGAIQIVELLLREHKEAFTSTQSNALGAASACIDFITGTTIVKMLLDHGAEPAGCARSCPIIEACQVGNVETVQLLLSYEAVDPSVRNDEALMRSTQVSSKLVSLLLADPRVNPNLAGILDVSKASVMKLLLEDSRIVLQYHYKRAILYAVSDINLETVELLLKVVPRDLSEKTCHKIVRNALNYRSTASYNDVLQDHTNSWITDREYEKSTQLLNNKAVKVMELLLDVACIRDCMTPQELDAISEMVGGQYFYFYMLR